MLQRDTNIINKLGLHARASAKLTQLAGSFVSQVKMSRNGRQVDAKSIMGVMMLAAGIGSTVTLETEGPDEQEAMDALLALIANRFGEGAPDAQREQRIEGEQQPDGDEQHACRQILGIDDHLASLRWPGRDWPAATRPEH